MMHRTVLEWQRIGHGDGPDEIPERQADRLAKVARASRFSGRGGNGVLEHQRAGLRARGVVGVISTPSCQLEILPKIEGSAALEDAPDTGTLRHRLIHMLAIANDIRIEAGAISPLAWQRDTLLEILIRLFCQKLSDALRQGMPRRYISHSDDLSTLRGSLNITRQFSRLAAQPQRLACHFDELSPDIALNQVMKAAITRLTRLSGAVDNQRTLREIGFAYGDISDVPTNSLRWDLIVLDRTNERWRDLVAFARLLLADKLQQTSTGATDGHALLFEMNVLFENYVARLLKSALSGSGFHVASQGGHRDCLYEGQTGRFRTKPDLIIRHGDQIVLIIDTKWKRVAPKIDDQKQGVSQGDVYQLMAYSQIYDCPEVMLLYPHHRTLPDAMIDNAYAIAARNGDRSLSVATLDVSNGRRAAKDALQKLVLLKLAKTQISAPPSSDRLALPNTTEIRCE